MDKSRLVSVVIPVYNSEKFLAQCLDSILKQTYKDIEIIAINDGSNDISLKILNQYSEKITIISQENQGLPSALNIGVNAMNGKWFKWFSPDDIMYPDTIEKLISIGKNMENTILYSNWDIIDEFGKVIRSFSESNYNDLDNSEFVIRLLDGQQINVNTTLIPSEIAKNLQFRNLGDFILTDYDFFLRAALLSNAKFFLIEKPLIKYRVHKNQFSHRNIIESLKNLEKVKVENLSKLDDKTRNLYLKNLEIYRKEKSISKKSLDLGLKLGLSILPSNIVEKILVYYLNNIRSSR